MKVTRFNPLWVSGGTEYICNGVRCLLLSDIIIIIIIICFMRLLKKCSKLEKTSINYYHEKRLGSHLTQIMYLQVTAPVAFIRKHGVELEP